MAWPTWMPTASRPATWPDWSTMFRSVIPREWPAGLFWLESHGWKDLVAFGEALALARDMLEFMLHNIWPTPDANYNIFTDRWEEVLDIRPDGSMDERTSRIIAHMRQRGTMTEDLVKAIMCQAFATKDPADVVLTSPDPADYTASGAVEAWQWAYLGHNMHISSSTNAECDRGLAEDLIRKIKPTWEYWSVGQYEELVWGTPNEEGAWDQAVWG